jgi:hypothetical protein
MPDQKDAIAILLAEFQALRTEIAGRSAAQATMMQLAITAFGAILGLIWLDHAANISNIGDFIKNQLMPALQKAAAMESLPDYEIFVRDYERTPGGFFRMFGLPPFLIFVLVPLVAMVLALESTPRGWLFWTLLVFDAGLLVVFTVRWRPFLDSPRQLVAGK